METEMETLAQIVDIEGKLADLSFNCSGSIFFNQHHKDGIQFRCSPSLPASMGPLVSEPLWRTNRARMDLDRGPFWGAIDLGAAMARNELAYVKTHCRPRMNYHRSNTKPQLPQEAVSLLERYLQVIQCTLPSSVDKDTHMPRLWHPDLHLDNIFVDPDSKQITSIIDWQGATVKPLFYQCGIAPAFEHLGSVSQGWAVPERPANYDSLFKTEKSKIDIQRRSEICHKYYQGRTSTNNPVHWAAMNLNHLELRVKPHQYTVGIWDDQNLYFFRKALIEIVERWQDLCPSSGPCPIGFSDEELALQPFEDQNMEAVLNVLALYLTEWGLQTDGKVDAEAFEPTLAAINEQRQRFINAADDDEERILFARLWPYQDGDRHGPV